MKKYIFFVFLPFLFSCNKSESDADDVIASKLNNIFDYSTIGIQKRYFEKHYGPAKRIEFGDGHQYEIGKCKINIWYDSNNAIHSVEMHNLSKYCTFKAKNILLDGNDPEIMAHMLTFGYFADAGISSPKIFCFEGCGNAVDPSYELTMDTCRAKSFIEYEAKMEYSAENEAEYLAGIKAAHRVGDELRSKYPDLELDGDDWEPASKAEFDALFFKEFRDVKLSSIRFGYGIIDET